MSLKERLLQKLQGRRKEATPRRIAQAIGQEEITMEDSYRYPVNDGVLEQKKQGGLLNTKHKQRR